MSWYPQGTTQHGWRWVCSKVDQNYILTVYDRIYYEDFPAESTVYTLLCFWPTLVLCRYAGRSPSLRFKQSQSVAPSLVHFLAVVQLLITTEALEVLQSIASQSENAKFSHNIRMHTHLQHKEQASSFTKCNYNSSSQHAHARAPHLHTHSSMQACVHEFIKSLIIKKHCHWSR